MINPILDNIILSNRAILEISGLDRKKFLQGLITNDINKATESNLIYSAMLNAQGRFLYDFFIFEQEEKLFIDCYKPRIDEIAEKLNFYKLRSQVKIVKNDEMLVEWNLLQNTSKEPGFKDPRHINLGYRFYKITKNFSQNQDLAIYHYHRIINKIAEGEHDLTYEKSFILEFDFDAINAVDYNKGCYVGQEPTARIHHLGQIRKKIFHIEIPEEIEKNSEISCEGKSAGLVLSSIYHKDRIHALALIKIFEEENFSTLKDKLEVNGNKIKVF